MKKLLLATATIAIIFSGCSSVDDNYKAKIEKIKNNAYLLNQEFYVAYANHDLDKINYLSKLKLLKSEKKRKILMQQVDYEKKLMKDVFLKSTSYHQVRRYCRNLENNAIMQQVADYQKYYEICRKFEQGSY